MSVELLWENEGRTWHHTHRLLSKRCGQNNSRGFLEAEWLRLQASSAGGIGSIPGQGTKFPQATWCSKKIKKKKKRFYIERRYFLYPQKRIPEQPWTCAVNWTPSRGDDLNSSSELPCMWGARTCLRGASPHLNFLGLLSMFHQHQRSMASSSGEHESHTLSYRFSNVLEQDVLSLMLQLAHVDLPKAHLKLKGAKEAPRRSLRASSRWHMNC